MVTARFFAGLGVTTAVLAGCGDQMRAIEKSMEPTIRSGEFVRADLDAYQTRAPQIGDVVSLVAPSGAAQERCGTRQKVGQPCPRPTPGLDEDIQLIKRVVAGPGDRIAISRTGLVVRNGYPELEAYANPCEPRDGCGLPTPAVIPAGHFFVLGDNRPYSSDSRSWGPVPRAAIKAEVIPLQRGSGDELP